MRETCPWCKETVEPTEGVVIGGRRLHQPCSIEYRLQEVETKVKELAHMVPA